MDKEPGQSLFEKARSFRYPPMEIEDAWAILEPWEKEHWANEQTAIEAPLLSEIERLKTRVAELEEALATNEIERQGRIKEHKRAEARVRHWEAATGEAKPRLVKARLEERDAIVGKLGEVIELVCVLLYGSEKGLSDTEAALRLHALLAYHASLTQEKAP